MHGILRRPSFDSTHSGRSSRSSRSSRRVSFADEIPPTSRRRSFPNRTSSFNSDTSSYDNIRYSYPSSSHRNELRRSASSRGRSTAYDVEEEFQAADRKKQLRKLKKKEEERKREEKRLREERRLWEKKELERRRRADEERRMREEAERRREKKQAARRRDKRKGDDRRRSSRSGREYVDSGRRHSRYDSAVDMTYAEAARRGSLPYVVGRGYMTPFRNH